jgi:ubiquinone/menaquinone biosynthesis C-methylase UbiE
MCDRLADFLSQKLDFHDLRVVLELGCGKGQLTIPLANRIGKVVRSFRMIAVDVSSGPYRGSLDVLRRRVREMGLGECVAVVEADCRGMKGVEARATVP